MGTGAQFHGTSQESFDLLSAIAHNCECKFGLMGVRIKTCLPHTALDVDQQWLDHLVFERRWFAVRFPYAGLRIIRPREERIE